MTHWMPNALMISGACSLEEPQPKFLPATMMSPFCICPASSGRRGLKPYCFISSIVFMARYSVGIMISVSISSPSTQTLPVIFSISVTPHRHFAVVIRIVTRSQLIAVSTLEIAVNPANHSPDTVYLSINEYLQLKQSFPQWRMLLLLLRNRDKLWSLDGRHAP